MRAVEEPEGRARPRGGPDLTARAASRAPEPLGRPWHCLPAGAVLEALGTSPEGLDTGEARRRLAAHGPNVLAEARRRTPLGLFLGQFTDLMILVLLAAAGVSGLVGALVDALAIVAIVLLNGVVGFVQEYRAERAMAALRAMAAPTATVQRAGGVLVVPAAEVVPGDVVLLEAGRIVPADLRLLETAGLRVDEAALTGESVPVDKTPEALGEEHLPLGDRRNMAYQGTVVTFGRGVGVVVATGRETEFGRIAALLGEAEERRTPLQRRLARFGQRLAVGVLGICALVFALGLVRGEPLLLMFLTAVSLAVAAIPEALPAVVTVSLARGARQMVARRALVRKLPAVETLGSVTYICSDKTGTLTLNRMRVEAVYCDGVLGPAPPANGPGAALLQAMALSNDATVDAGGHLLGDPTEVALLAAARAAGVEKAREEVRLPRIAEIPFEAGRKRMTTLHRDPAGGVLAFTKGAVEAVLPACRHLLTARGAAPLDAAEVLRVADRMAGDGLRVLALAMRRWPEPPTLEVAAVEADLTFLGLVGLLDPPREGAAQAIRTCREAGIVPVMITGDHPLTARAAARRLGILGPGDDAVLTGPELEALPLAELEARVGHVRVYARVAPEQKLTIVTALQACGEIVAMTGDGVNDAPALRRADIGVAMGVAGTDVAREASAMVLLDDDFTTIVEAVREGRRIYDNLRKFVKYVMTGNAAEIVTLLLAPLLGLPLPLLPVHLLWINLVTDGLPGLALGREPAEPDVMRRPPRPPGESVFARGLGTHMVWAGLLMGGLCLLTQALFLPAGPRRWQTMVFTVLALAQLGHVLAIRSDRESFLARGLGSNRPLVAAVALSVALQVAILYVPALNRVFRTEPLGAVELAVTVALASVVFVAVEVEKAVRRWRPAARRRTAETGGNPEGPGAAG